MKEELKTVQEVAKATGKVADVAAKVGGFISKVIGGPCTQGGGILEDWVRYYRYKSLLIISDKVAVLHRRRKIEGKTISVPLRVAIPLLEAASLEEDSILQDIWARLIANSMDPEFEQSIHPSYIEIVKQMCPDEAIILEAFHEIESYPTLFVNHVSQDARSGKSSPSTYEGIYADYVIWCKELPLKRQKYARAFLDNLLRLQLLEIGYDLSSHMQDQVKRSEIWSVNSGKQIKQTNLRLYRNEYLRMTAYGEGFVTACIRE